MLTVDALNIRDEWHTVVDSVIKEKPAFIKLTQDCMMLSDIGVIEDLLTAYSFTARLHVEDDGTITLGLVEIDLAENGSDKQDAVRKLAQSILDYAEDYYREFRLWYSAPNRKAHLPYVIKALILNDVDALGGLITCHPGKI